MATAGNCKKCNGKWAWRHFGIFLFRLLFSDRRNKTKWTIGHDHCLNDVQVAKTFVSQLKGEGSFLKVTGYVLFYLMFVLLGVLGVVGILGSSLVGRPPPRVCGEPLVIALMSASDNQTDLPARTV